ncbi:MAG TPA: shikimate kinase [Parachlamydiaceae bacterium]|nr:shikimate kinase [Parachlamydiaceae bacterium]
MNSNNLILFGHKASGKTYFGKKLAKQQKKKFIDTDRLIEKHYQKEFQQTLKCREIFNRLGEKEFRLLEKIIIKNLKGIKNTIIAVGGGSLLDPENLKALKKLGTFMRVQTDKETVRQRIFKSGIPPFLESEDPENAFEKFYEMREAFFSQIEN